MRTSKGGRDVAFQAETQAPEKNRQQAAPRDARLMEEIKNRRYLAFVRAIVNGFAVRSAR